MRNVGLATNIRVYFFRYLEAPGIFRKKRDFVWDFAIVLFLLCVHTCFVENLF